MTSDGHCRNLQVVEADDVTGIKICGITRLQDALHAARCGADALGFIFYPRSPRYIAPEKAKAIIEALTTDIAAVKDIIGGIFPAGSSRITTVGVFVNEEIDKVQEIVSICGLDLIQLHGDETADYVSRFPSDRIIKAFGLKTPEDLEKIGEYRVRAILIDAHDTVRYGGTGQTSNWELASRAARMSPLILSGGLNIVNIREAIKAVKPQAVDINSGVETAPGIKDHKKITAIIDWIRNTP